MKTNIVRKILKVEFYAGSDKLECKAEIAIMGQALQCDILFNFNGVIHRYVYKNDMFIDSTMLEDIDLELNLKKVL